MAPGAVPRASAGVLVQVHLGRVLERGVRRDRHARVGMRREGDVRDPVDVVPPPAQAPAAHEESLAAKFCPPTTTSRARSKPPHVDFLETAAALWPERTDWNTSGCVDALGWYVALYTRDMLAAKDAGFIADAFRVEDTPPCEVASRAGLLLTNARARAAMRDGDAKDSRRETAASTGEGSDDDDDDGEG